MVLHGILLYTEYYMGLWLVSIVCNENFMVVNQGSPLPNWWAYTWRFVLTNFVVLCRILFRAPDLESSWMIFSGLFDFYFVLPRYSPLWPFLPWAMPFTSHQDLGNEILLPIAFSLCGQRRRPLLLPVLRLFVGRWVLAKHSHLSTISFKPLLVV